LIVFSKTAANFFEAFDVVNWDKYIDVFQLPAFPPDLENILDNLLLDITRLLS
jgi:hypothetical protein